MDTHFALESHLAFRLMPRWTRLRVARDSHILEVERKRHESTHRMRPLLDQASVPYLVTALLLACGWGIVHVIDRLTEAPSMEYCVTLERADEVAIVKVSLENLSLTTKFRMLKFNLGDRENGEELFSRPRIVEDPPAFQGSRKPEGGRQLEFEIAAMNPGDRIEVTAKYPGVDLPPLRLMQSKDSMLLLECSPLTYLLKHQLAFVFLFSVVALVVIVLLLHVRSRDAGPKLGDD